MIWALSYDLMGGEQKLIQSINQNYLSINHEADDYSPETISVKSYPNPFNSDNTIELNIRYSEKISIELFSLNGSLISELLNKRLNEGKFYLTWEVENIYPKPSSGILIIRASGESTEITKKYYI